jgi:hypothetical protein
VASAFDDSGLRRVGIRMNRLADLDAEDLADIEDAITRIIIEDNRKGVLEGTDRNDIPAPPLKYRDGLGAKTRARSLRSESFGTIRGRFKGVEAARGRVLANNNLTTAAYKRLTGPRDAPRRESSRVITNLRPLPSEKRGTEIAYVCGWVDVVSPKGFHFLPALFDGKSGAPPYDLRGVRRWGRDKARMILREWMKRLIGA